jgi:competence protein ComGC
MKKVLVFIIIVLLIIIFWLANEIATVNKKCKRFQEINDRQSSAIEMLKKERTNSYYTRRGILLRLIPSHGGL